MQVDFTFTIGDQVTIPGGSGGKIIGLYVGRYGEKMVHVEYTDQVGSSHTKYFDEADLKP
jgi:hypothetical protein